MCAIFRMAIAATALHYIQAEGLFIIHIELKKKDLCFPLWIDNFDFSLFLRWKRTKNCNKGICSYSEYWWIFWHVQLFLVKFWFSIAKKKKRLSAIILYSRFLHFDNSLAWFFEKFFTNFEYKSSKLLQMIKNLSTPC